MLIGLVWVLIGTGGCLLRLVVKMGIGGCLNGDDRDRLAFVSAGGVDWD